MKKLNNRPRKTLGLLTQNEVFFEIIENILKIDIKEDIINLEEQFS